MHAFLEQVRGGGKDELAIFFMVKMLEPFNSTPHMECGGLSCLCTIAGKTTPEVDDQGLFL
jgi:hypothetical protein